VSTHDHMCISHVRRPMVTFVASLGVLYGLLTLVGATDAPDVSMTHRQVYRFVNGAAAADMSADESLGGTFTPLILKEAAPD